MRLFRFLDSHKADHVYYQQILQRPEFRNIGLSDLIPIALRMPIAAKVSILHRISGMLMFLLLPFIVWLFDKSVSSQVSWERFTGLFNGSLGMPGWFYKLIGLLLIWSFLHHLIAGLRHIYMDFCHSAVNKQFGRSSAIFTLVLSLGLTVLLGAKLFGLF